MVIGDEDESTHGLAVHLKQHVPRCGVLELPKCGHTMNLEEPAAFNSGRAGLPARRRERPLAGPRAEELHAHPAELRGNTGLSRPA